MKYNELANAQKAKDAKDLKVNVSLKRYKRNLSGLNQSE
jgi:hypothetical protein